MEKCSCAHSVMSDSLKAMDCSPGGFSAHEIFRHCSGLPFPPSGDLLDPEIRPESPASPALVGGFFTIESPGKPKYIYNDHLRQSIHFMLAQINWIHFCLFSSKVSNCLSIQDII